MDALNKFWEKKSAQLKKFYCKLVSEFNPSSVHFKQFYKNKYLGYGDWSQSMVVNIRELYRKYFCYCKW